MSVGKLGIIAFALAVCALGCENPKSRGQKASPEQIQRKRDIADRQARKSEFAKEAIPCKKIKDVRQVQLETACRTEAGKLFLRVDDGAYAGLGWQDLQTAVVWYDALVRQDVTDSLVAVGQLHASSVCERRGLALPSADDFTRSATAGLSDVLCLTGSECQGFKNKGFAFWSATASQSNLDYYFIYDLQANVIPGAIHGNVIHATLGAICIQK